MPFDFKALAERAMTVEVGGAPVHLRPPPPEGRVAVHMAMRVDGEVPSETDPQNVVRWQQACALALSACVVDHDEVTVDDWQRVVMTVDTGETEGLEELILSAMELCGFRGARGTIRKAASVADHAAEAADAAGNSRSK